MLLDDMTRRNLELVESIRPGEGGTLLEVLDETVTAMGGRLLRKWVLRPLVEASEIWERQEAVEELYREGRFGGSSGRASAGCPTWSGWPGKSEREGSVPGISWAWSGPSPTCLGSGSLASRVESSPPLVSAGGDGSSYRRSRPPGGRDLSGRSAHPAGRRRDSRGVRSGPGRTPGHQGRGRDFIASLQARERERTGIGSLKVGFNRVFGYYLEVTKANLEKVPEDYVRKQTLANAERFFTPELKEWEEKVFGAEDRIQSLEAEIFGRIRGEVASRGTSDPGNGRPFGEAGRTRTFAEVARDRGYTRPEVHTGFEVDIRGGRHPVVETMMPREEFIPNDLLLDEEGRIIILTGPNMAGKSTVLRQIGLIQLLAQVGAFVPASAARLPLCDRIFTRVGASDSLARGQSTFMVEMNETAAIVHGASETSLILLDEIGRGTSTYDGVSIAWAVTEHLHEWVGAKTIFATHYHELTQLGDLLPQVRNLNVAVREVGEDIVFLRRLEEGGADRSYGIQVARLAGLPAEAVGPGKGAVGGVGRDPLRRRPGVWVGEGTTGRLPSSSGSAFVFSPRNTRWWASCGSWRLRALRPWKP